MLGRSRFPRRIVRGAAAVLLAATAAPADVVTLGTHAFQLLDDTQPPISPTKRKFSFASRTGKDADGHRVIPSSPGGAGDPTVAGLSGGGAVLAIYNANGSGESYTYALPAVHWRHEGSLTDGRWVYSDLTSQPVYKIWVKRDKITIRGGRGAWGYTLDEPLQGRLALTLTLGMGDTWCVETVPRTPAATFDRQDRFLGRIDTPAPAACPPPPDDQSM